MTMNDTTRLARIVALAGEKLGEAASLADFAALYFNQPGGGNAQELDDARLADILASHYRLLQEYDGTAPKIRVFTPAQGDSVVEVVMRDRPFLVDTLKMGIESQGLALHQLLHTIVHVSRDAQGAITGIGAVTDSDEKHLSVMFAQTSRMDEADMAALGDILQEKIAVLDSIVGDWAAMQDKLQAAQAEMAAALLPAAVQNRDAAQDFLRWILDGNFTFLGYREYRIGEVDGEAMMIAVGGSGLGLLRNDGESDKLSHSFQELPAALRAQVLAPQAVLLSKSSRIAPVHRHAYMDFLGVQRFDEKGKVIGEHRFVGLLTASAYQLGTEQIPLLRDKAQAVLARAQLPRGGHAWKKLRHILDSLPRDDLFQGSVDDLYPIAIGILQLHDKSRLRLFARVDHYQRFVSCLVYVPRDRYNTALREKIQTILQTAFAGYASEFTTQFSDAQHVRVHVHVRTRAGHIPVFDLAAIEQQLAQAMRDWQDDFATHAGDNALARRYGSAFPAAYREDFTPAQALSDIHYFARLDAQHPLALKLHAGENGRLYLNLYGLGEAATLTKVLPILENFGVTVSAARPYAIHSEPPVWLQQYDLHGEAADLTVVKTQFEEGFRRIWQGDVESDRFNALVLSTELDIDEVTVLRALARYITQAGAPFSLDYLQQTVNGNRDIAVALIRLFHARMHPAREAGREQAVQEALAHIHMQLQSVKSLDEDRIIRWYLDLLKAMLRTNFYQREANGQRKNRLSFKFAASEIPGLPKPKPMFEIYVYSPRVEAVHLRGGKVARGGLRWSDRMEDFRTEVLGLVKAQMVKNAVIVPLGSKGGFVVKQPPAARDAYLEEGKECYRTFIRGLLDITDNLVDGAVVPPANTVRHDNDDPYLVVAADKGTASFSDIANAISAEYGFWLGDAFASGGSAGYDHKGMGITARGAWESVKRHFRMLGKDIQDKDEFSVLGIGDMSGDVFGNGMLLSRNILLKAAFNHQHIFIDPTPDARASFAERERLFKLPRSTWADYDSALISAGGGVFSRADKAIAITPQMQAAFDITEDSLTPTELIHRLLKAPLDLIWNGGIGTYVKSRAETHAQVGDRANDGLRVDGCELRARVIGEGGNLGMTQRGRIEAALSGVRLNTDAIDNSGGVNCSDHEVNIKILLNQAIEAGELDNAARNQLLASMTDSVAAHVLRQNYLQPQVLDMSAAQPREMAEHGRIMRQLEQEGRLDRAIEFLPDDAALAERAQQGKGLTHPELAVLLAYAKMWVYDHLLASALPDSADVAQELYAYFPAALGDAYGNYMHTHRLKREIISTWLTNDVVNRLGISFVFRAAEDSGESVANIVACYVLARDVFAADRYWQALETLDNRVPAALQLELAERLRHWLERAATWFLRNLAQPVNLREARERFAIAAWLDTEGLLGKRFAGRFAALAETWRSQGVPADVADAFALLPLATLALDVAEIAERSGHAPEQVAQCFFAVRERLHGDWLSAQINALPAADVWERRARSALLGSFQSTLRSMVLPLLESGETLAQWAGRREKALAKLDEAVGEWHNREASLAALSVVLGEMAVLGSSA